MATNVLFLEDVPEAERLALLVGSGASRADSPLQAARAIASTSPEVLVVGSEAHWAHDLIAGLPPTRRPAVVGVGSKTPALFGLVDRWLKPRANTAQVEKCIETALGYARRRTESGVTLLCDPDTGLPTRWALIGALVRKAQRAQNEELGLSVVVIRIAEDRADPAAAFRRLATLLGESTRRNEITARVGDTRTATLVVGGSHTAELARDRFAAQLKQQGIAASVEVQTLRASDAVSDLMRAIGDHPALEENAR